MPDGTLDYGFDVALSSELMPLALAADRDGGVIVGGIFSGLQGQSHPNLLRLLPATGCEPGVIQMTVPTLLSKRDEAAVVVPVTRRGGADTEQSVEFSTQDGSAQAGVDYEAVSGTLLFSRGQQSQCIRIPLKRGNQNGTKTFEVRLSQVGNGASLGPLTNVVVTLTNSVSGSAGAPDTNYLVQLDGPVQAIIPLEGGRALIAGAFTNVNGQFCPNLTRLQADGTRDPGFVRAKALDGDVRALALDESGRVLAAGCFCHVDGVWRPGLARFLSDGTLDPDFGPFDSWLTNNYTAEMEAVAVLTDGSIVCGGSVPDLVEGYRDVLLKFSPTDKLDLAFSNNLPFEVRVAGLQALSNGGFLQVGSGLGGSIVSLNSDGTINFGFIPPADRQFGMGGKIELLPDGRVVLGGLPDAYSGLVSLPPLGRLAPDGSQDASFSASPDPGSSWSVEALSASEDGRVVFAGDCSTANTDLYAVQRVYADGSVDGSFDCGSGLALSSNGWFQVNALKPLSTGGWLVGGDFSGYDGFNQRYLVKVLPETPVRPPTFSFTVTNVSLAETNSTIDLEVRRRGDASDTVNVSVFTQDGTAIAGQDYQPINTNLVFGAGEWSKTVAVTLLDDRLVEGLEQFTVRLTNATGGFAIVSPATVTVSIQDYNAGVEFLSDEFNGRVEDGFAMVGVRWFGKRSVGSQATVNIVPVTGHAEDLGISSVAVSVGATNWVRIPIVDNAQHEATRQFRLELIGGANVIPGPGAVATLSIDDSNFATTPARGVAGIVEAMANSRGGGAYLAGDFMGVHGMSRQNVARLRPDGEVDASFDPGDGPNAKVTAIAEQPDGKVIIAGDFTAVGTVPRAGVARLNDDGSVDLTFDPGLGAQMTNGTRFIRVVLPQSDGSVYIGGAFTQFNSRYNRALVRLQSNGSVDTGFTSPFCDSSVWSWPPGPVNENAVYGVAVQPDGKVIVVGVLQLRQTNLLQTVQYGVVRLDQKGRVETTLTKGISAAKAVALANEDTILVGGASSPLASWVPISCFRTNGTADVLFQVRDVPPESFATSEIRQLLRQPDDRILFSAAIYRLGSQSGHVQLHS